MPGTKAVLFALTDALDIGPVHPDDHAAHDGSSHHADDEVASGKALEQAVDEGQHRIGCRHCNAAQRHHAGGHKAEQKNDGQHRQEDGLDRQDGPSRHQHALAALEAEINSLVWPTTARMAVRYTPR